MESTEIKKKMLFLSGITNNNIEEEIADDGRSRSVSNNEKLRAIKEAMQYLQDQSIVMKEKPESFDAKKRFIDSIDIR